MSHNSDFTTISSWSGGGTTITTSESGWHPADSSDNYIINPKSFTFGAEKSTTDDTTQYKGVLYDWGVATAGVGNYSVTTAGTKVNDSICPKNWKIPSGYGIKSFQNLLNNYSNKVTPPISIIRAGCYEANGYVYYTNRGFYWTNESDPAGVNASQARYISFDGSNNHSFGVGNRRYGFSIRCVSR